MKRNIKRIVIAIATIFMLAYFINRFWRVDGINRSHGIIEETLGVYDD